MSGENTASDKERVLKELVGDFWQWVDACYGLYRDAHEAFPALAKEKKALITEQRKWGDLRAEDISIAYPRLQKSGATAPRHIHQAGLPIVIERNAFEGSNTKFIGRMMIVAIYSHWETTQKELELLLGGRVQIPIMGDIRALRRAIVHNKSKTTELKKLALLPELNDGATISPAEPQIGKIVDEIHKCLEEFVSNSERFLDRPAT